MSTHGDLAALDATGQAALVHSGQVTPLELVDAAIARIEAVNPTVNAVIHERFERARTEATGPLPDGPFRGVPLLLKDLSAFSAGDPHHGGAAFLKEAGWIADRDDHVTLRLRDAGFVVVGRANTPEFGTTITTEPVAHGPSRNPWNPDHSTGGSSGGSAAAVASRMVPAAHASDGGGSIRVPASECGIVGLKPTRGRVPLGPEVGRDPGRLRIGVLDHPLLAGVEGSPACTEAVRATAALLDRLGHDVHDSHPAPMTEDHFTHTFIVVVATHVAHDLDAWGRVIGRTVVESDIEPGNWMFAGIGRSLTAPDYLDAIYWQQEWSRRMSEWWRGGTPESGDGFDLLVTPVINGTPPPLGHLTDPAEGLGRVTELMQYTAQFNVTGQPAISLPLWWSEDGLPIGIQFVAAFGREDLLIRIASELEMAQPWVDRVPPIHA